MESKIPLHRNIFECPTIDCNILDTHWEPKIVSGTLTVPFNLSNVDKFSAFASFDYLNKVLVIYSTIGISVFSYPEGININYFEDCMYPIYENRVAPKAYIPLTFNMLLINSFLGLDYFQQLLVLSYKILTDIRTSSLRPPTFQDSQFKVRNKNLVKSNTGKFYTQNGVEVFEKYSVYYSGLVDDLVIYNDTFCGISIQAGLVYNIKFMGTYDSYFIPFEVIDVKEE